MPTTINPKFIQMCDPINKKMNLDSIAIDSYFRKARKISSQIRVIHHLHIIGMNVDKKDHTGYQAPNERNFMGELNLYDHKPFSLEKRTLEMYSTFRYTPNRKNATFSKEAKQ